MHIALLVIVFAIVSAKISAFDKAAAFTYTTADQDYFSNVTGYGFKTIYVYAGDVEMYCRGIQGSNPDTPCVFSGSGANSYIYYTEFARQAVIKYKNAGFNVYLNFDGRIGEYVPNFSQLSLQEVEDMASTLAGIVCGESNAIGLGWDVEPFDNNQVSFFATLDRLVSVCKKTWGIFTFAERFNSTMWTTGLGNSGILLDSTYDLECSTCRPCQCVPPTANDARPGQDNYASIFTTHLNYLISTSAKYNKKYQLFVAGSGTTQIYEYSTLANCFNQTCPWKMSDWLRAWINTADSSNLKQDPRFLGVAVYDWAPGNNGGYFPNTPEPDFIQLLKSSGYL